MRPYLYPFLLLALYIYSCSTQAQAPDKAVTDAFVVTRMVEKYHVAPRPLDQQFSQSFYTALFKELDEDKLFFTREDSAKLSKYRSVLNDQVLQRNPAFLILLSGIYKERLLQLDTMIDHIAAQPFPLATRELFSVTEQETYPIGIAGMHSKLYKTMKLSTLTNISNYSWKTGQKPSQALTDSLEAAYRKKSAASFKRWIKRMLQNPLGFDELIGTVYCQVLSTCFDPHTEFLPPDLKASWESELGNKPLAFGLTLSEDEDGHAQIAKLFPGSPAYLCGVLNEGDKIIAIKWDNKETIDVSTASLTEVNEMLAEEGGLLATISVKKQDGSNRQAALFKARLDVEVAEEKVQGFLLKGATTIGYISLPAFYSDWQDEKGVNGCANDVARQILKLKRENISGLIIDIRYNGGGSLTEAVDLTGLFIDAGPVGMTRGRDGKSVTLKDVNRGTIYDGPLIILVNGFSASASEMVAGTLQDYNRALIVGSPTYGKATAQVILPMDTTVDLANYDGRGQASSYLKVTIDKLYRVNGTTAQFNGVRPDILLPDPAGTVSERESDEPSALQPTTIEPNKYYHPLPALPLAVLQARAKELTDSSAWFRAATQAAGKPRKPATQDIWLSLAEIGKWKEQLHNSAAAPDSAAAANQPFTIQTFAAMEQRMKTDPSFASVINSRKTVLQSDAYLGIAYQLLTRMNK